MSAMALDTRSSALAGMPPGLVAARMTAQPAPAASSRTSGSLDRRRVEQQPAHRLRGGGDARREDREVG